LPQPLGDHGLRDFQPIAAVVIADKSESRRRLRSLPSRSSHNALKFRGNQFCAIVIALQAHGLGLDLKQIIRQRRSRLPRNEHSRNSPNVLIVFVLSLDHVSNANRVPVIQKNLFDRLAKQIKLRHVDSHY
jgi:hypothetical protein